MISVLASASQCVHLLAEVTELAELVVSSRHVQMPTDIVLVTVQKDSQPKKCYSTNTDSPMPFISVYNIMKTNVIKFDVKKRCATCQPVHWGLRLVD